MVSETTWRYLPQLLHELFRRERILLCVIEETESRLMLLFGGSGFLEPTVLNNACSRFDEFLLERAFSRELKGTRSFLGYRQIAEANERGDLRLLNFFGAPRGFDPTNPRAPLPASKFVETWNFFHMGYQLKEVWVEFSDPVRTAVMAATGLELIWQREGIGGDTVSRFRVGKEHAIKNPAGWPFHALLSARPDFSFTRAQQKILELALLDRSDREICAELALSPNTLKKRWRSIYRTVRHERVDFPDHPVGKRNELLEMVRSNLAELRPYRRPGRALFRSGNSSASAPIIPV
ncbi:MAG TPA: hypothetical protein VHU83_14535 [Bryobacteraceae bacterium]|nr:hypothetical protein [Bryobacteraceae bacterium]